MKQTTNHLYLYELDLFMCDFYARNNPHRTGGEEKSEILYIFFLAVTKLRFIGTSYRIESHCGRRSRTTNRRPIE